MAASLSQQENEEQREEEPEKEEQREEEPEPDPGVPGEQGPSEDRAKALRALLSARKRKAGLEPTEGKVLWPSLGDLTVPPCGVRAVW